MKLTGRVQDAITKATVLHRKNRRKDFDIPYIMHPFSVMLILSEYTTNEDILIAGLMHDTVEDVRNYSFEKLEKDCGAVVAGLVRDVSEESTTLFTRLRERKTWRARKIKYVEGLARASKGALLIAAADKIHNMRSMVNSYHTLKDRLWKQFNAADPQKDYTWFYESILEVLEKRLTGPIVMEYKQAFSELKKAFRV